MTAGMVDDRSLERRAGLEPLLAPRSIAVVGASTNMRSVSGLPLKLLKQRNFPGAIYPVNPNRDEISGLPAYASIGACPSAVDLAVVVVRSEFVLGIVRECVAAGTGAIVVISSGFAEVGTSGAAVQAELAQIAREAGVRIAGPNSEGFMNVLADIPATFSPTFDLEVTPAPARKGNIALVSQSGSLAFTVGDTLNRAGLGLSYIVTTGNEADVDSLDVTEFCVEDDTTTVIAMIVEGFPEPARLKAIAASAHERGKSLVVAKLGRSSAGQRAALSHTGHLAGAAAAYAGAFASYGVHSALDQEDLVDTCIALSRCRSMPGNRVGIVTRAGGSGVWLADSLEDEGFVVPDLSAGLQDELRQGLPAFGSTRNPVDLTAHNFELGGEARAIEMLLGSGEVDGVVIVKPLNTADPFRGEADRLRSIVADSERPVVLYSLFPQNTPEAAAQLEQLGIPWAPSPRRTARMISALARAGRERAGESEDRPQRELPLPASGASSSEHEVKIFLRSVGLPVPRGGLATAAPQAAVIADDVGYPVVMKVQSPEIVHKSDVGGVALGVGDPDAVRAAFDRLVANATAARPDARIEGVLVEGQSQPGFEMIVGVVADPDFGPQVLVGAGGIHAEALADSVLRPAPVSRRQAREMIASLRCGPAFRDDVPRALDTAALVEVLVAVSEVAAHHVDGIGEMDLNPVVVYETGQGLCILDAWIGRARPERA
jgi:acyl-CoA synthetase (NDP forming)